MLTLMPEPLNVVFLIIKQEIQKIKQKNSKIKVLIISLLFFKKYSLSKKSYIVIGNTQKKFYYWLKFSTFRFRKFNSKRLRFVHRKFLYFYFSPNFSLIRKRNVLKHILRIKKKISLLKKRNSYKKWILFKSGSRAWKFVVTRRPRWRRNVKMRLKPLHIIKKPLNLSNNNYRFYLNKRVKWRKIRRRKEINIKSRFNRIFYENRNIFSYFFNKSKLRQKKFNQHYTSWFKKNYYNILLTFEFSLKNILLKSRFIFTETQCNFLLNSGIVFLNGINTYNKNSPLKVGDRVQLIITKNYYFYFRQILSDILYLKKFIGYRVWRLVRFNNNLHKQSATHIPNWVLLLSNYFLDIPKFLQTDFIILTTIIIYRPTHFNDFSAISKHFINFFLMRLYNWRYIV